MVSPRNKRLNLRKGAAMAIKKSDKKVQSPPDTSGDYREYVTTDSKEADALSRIANREGGMDNPSVKILGFKMLPNKLEEFRFLKRLALVLILSSILTPGFALANRDDAGFDNTLSFSDRQVNTDGTEIFARSRTGIEISPVQALTAKQTVSLITGDYYYITGDTAIEAISSDSTYAGRRVTLSRPKGTPNSVQIRNGRNISLERNWFMFGGDTIELVSLPGNVTTASDDSQWYQVSSSDN